MAEHLISNSEMYSYLQCRRQFWYSHIKRLAPRVLEGPLNVGITGHSALEAYLEALMAGEDFDEAQKAAYDALGVIVRDGKATMKDINSARIGLTNFFNHPASKMEGCEVIGVEESHKLKLNDWLYLPMRYDVLYRDPDGKIVLRDYKFCYDLWPIEGHTLNIQMPKYMAVLAMNDIVCNAAEIVEIRYRNLKEPTHDSTIRVTRYEPNSNAMANVLRDHIQVSREIADFHEADPIEQSSRAVRIGNKQVCKYCAFAEVCAVELKGEDATALINADFVENTYGYQLEDESRKM